jgi:hypothetical protein
MEKPKIRTAAVRDQVISDCRGGHPYGMPEAFVSSESKITLQRKELHDRVWRTPMRLDPLNRIDTVLAQFRGLEDSEDLVDAQDSLDEQEI